MALVSGIVWTPQRAPFLANQAFRMIFKLSEPATNGIALLIASADMVIVPDTLGAFEADLQVTTNLLSQTYYTVTFEWLSGENVPIGFDSPAWKIRVPPEGGEIGSLIDAQSNPDLVWAGANAPADPAVYAGWINTTNSTFYEWE